MAPGDPPRPPQGGRGARGCPLAPHIHKGAAGRRRHARAPTARRRSKLGDNPVDTNAKTPTPWPPGRPPWTPVFLAARLVSRPPAVARAAAGGRREDFSRFRAETRAPQRGPCSCPPTGGTRLTRRAARKTGVQGGLPGGQGGEVCGIVSTGLSCYCDRRGAAGAGACRAATRGPLVNVWGEWAASCAPAPLGGPGRIAWCHAPGPHKGAARRGPQFGAPVPPDSAISKIRKISPRPRRNPPKSPIPRNLPNFHFMPQVDFPNHSISGSMESGKPECEPFHPGGAS